MLIRLLYIFVSFLIDVNIYIALCRNTPEWVPAPGRWVEAVLLLIWLLLLVGIIAIQVLLWYKLKWHLPVKPEPGWESKKQSFKLPGQKEQAPTSTQEKEELNHTICLLPIVLVYSFVSSVISDADKNFVDAVKSEYYLTADIYHSVLQADANKGQALFRIIGQSVSTDVKMRQVKYLLSKGANPDQPSNLLGNIYTTPISLAVQRDEHQLLPPLLEPCRKGKLFGAVLTRPVRDGDSDTVRLLLKHGAEVNLTDEIEGKTALHQAASPLHEDKEVALEIARQLLQAGAAVNAVYLTQYPPFAQTALDLAESAPSFPEMAELIRKNGGKRAIELIDEYRKEKASH